MDLPSMYDRWAEQDRKLSVELFGLRCWDAAEKAEARAEANEEKAQELRIRACVSQAGREARAVFAEIGAALQHQETGR